MGQELDLAQYLEGAKRQDQDASRALVEGLYPLVIRIVRGHLPEPSAQEDLAQEIFMKLFDRLDRYEVRAGVPFEHWVSRLAVRTCLDTLRAKHRRPEVRWTDLGGEQQAWLSFVLADDAPPPYAAAESAREVVGKLLSQLPPADRLVITLLDLEGKSVKEIARLTGWSVTLVKVRAFRARRRLRKLAEALKANYPYEEL